MLRACEEAVGKLWKSLGQKAGLCAASTSEQKNLMNRVWFIRQRPTGFEQKSTSNPQVVFTFLPLFILKFYPVSTMPNVTTKLIKEYSL